MASKANGFNGTYNMLGAVGIELKVTLKARKLLILLKDKNANYTGIAQLRYTPGTLAKIPTYA